MRRVIVLGALVLVGALSVAAFQQPAAQEMVVTVEKVKDNFMCCAEVAVTPPRSSPPTA